MRRARWLAAKRRAGRWRIVTMCVAVLAACVTTSGCGAGKRASSSSAKTSARAAGADANDGDGDAANVNDDRSVLGFGRPATATELQQARALVKRYYTAAASGDGVGGCAQIFLILRESIPESYGNEAGPQSLRGNTCAVVMTKLFEQRHARFSAELGKLEVTGMRIEGRRGFALLRFGAHAPPEDLSLHSELGSWRVDALLPASLP